MIKDKYTLSIQDVSVIFEKDSPRLISTVWLPGFILRRYYARFLMEFSEMFNGHQMESLLSDDIYRLKIINRVNNILFPMYQGLALELFISREIPEFRKMYEEVMGRKYNGKEDLKAIIKEIERLKSKLAEVPAAEMVVSKNKKLSFEQVIANTEVILDRSLDRNMKLFQFKKQYDLAIARAKEYEKLRSK